MIEDLIALTIAFAIALASALVGVVVTLKTFTVKLITKKSIFGCELPAPEANHE